MARRMDLRALLVLALMLSVGTTYARSRGPSDCKLRFIGAAGQVTGSMHQLETRGRRLLVDCGLKQGLAARGASRKLPDGVSRSDAMILTHAHVDHSGNIPLLVKKGYRGKIHCTRATAELCKGLLLDSAKIQERKAQDLNRAHRRDRSWQEVKPSYTVRDAERALSQLRPHAYGEEFAPLPGVKASFSGAGHILGSATVSLDLKVNNQQRRIAFSGDIGRRNSFMLKPPVPPAGADYVVMESTYGGRSHAPSNDMKRQLHDTIRSTSRRGGKVIIPSFALQRTQEIVYLLNQLKREGKLNVPVFVDSPLGTKLTQVFRRHQGLLGRSASTFARRHGDPFTFPGLTLVSSTDESRQLNRLPGPAVIISSSGMCTAGRVIHHLRNNITDQRNTVAIVGYQGEGTLGRKLVEQQRSITIKQRAYPVRAKIKVLNAFSAHADKGDLLWWANACGPRVKKFFLVHGEQQQSEALRLQLQRNGRNAVVPSQGQVVELD